MEENKTKIFWKPIDGEEFKELEYIGKVEGFDFEQLEEPIEVKYDTTPVTKGWSFSLDMVLDNKQSKEIRKLFYCRIPRKAKKRFKTNMCKHGWDIKKLKFSYKRLNMDMAK